MSRWLLKGSLATSLMAVLAGVSIPAEAAQVSCRVPFSFTVNGSTLPPGIYYVSTEVTQDLLAIRGDRGFAFAIANYIESGGGTEAKLVFHKYGDQYYLREVWWGGRSGRELRNRAKGEPIKTAGGALTPERVVVAAQ
jgi:hypothetical protein